MTHLTRCYDIQQFRDALLGEETVTAIMRTVDPISPTILKSQPDVDVFFGTCGALIRERKWPFVYEWFEAMMAPLLLATLLSYATWFVMLFIAWCYKVADFGVLPILFR